MPVPELCALDDHRIISASGPDSAAFLQGQLTQDINNVSADNGRLAGWADARGRLLWAGPIWVHDERYCMLVPAACAASLLSRLRMFVLRARTEIAIADLAIVGVIQGNDDTAGHQLLPAGWAGVRLAAGPGRSLRIGPPAGLTEVADAATMTPESRRAWELREIHAGIPEIGAATSGEFVPQMVNLDLLDGISFTKGCYTGQEIVARTRYLGRIKRRMLRFSCPGEVSAGETIYGMRGPAGQVVRAAPTGAGSELLAVVSLDGLGAPLHADEARMRPLTRLALPYVVPA